MPARAPFFQISPDTYLYPHKVKETVIRKRLEEPVRQWCAHELIRAYGISVANIEFERPVRMGSRPHWIDILVSREGKAVVVVECKKPSARRLEDGMKQALSYAEAPELRAEFAVVTNGTDWHVRRRVHDEWCAVADLPRELDQKGAEPVTELLRGLDTLAPLLYELDQPLAGEDAECFLRAMQNFFCGMNLLTDDIDHDLVIGTDNLLRVLSSADWGHPNYRFGKLATAMEHFESYQNRKGIAIEFSMSNMPIPHEIQYLHASMLRVTESPGNLAVGEVYLLRLVTALAEYGMRQGRAKALYPKCAPSLQTSLRDYLNYALLVHLNVSLPDHLDDIWMGDMRGYCQSAWERVVAERKCTFREFAAAWVSFLFSKIAFWKRLTSTDIRRGTIFSADRSRRGSLAKHP